MARSTVLQDALEGESCSLPTLDQTTADKGRTMGQHNKVVGPRDREYMVLNHRWTSGATALEAVLLLQTLNIGGCGWVMLGGGSPRPAVELSGT